MKDIKQIIANNLISLRKKNNLTQNELAVKINYSDNAISRWEHAEVTPSIETLQHIADVFNVPLRSLIEDNAVVISDRNDHLQMVNKLAMILISVSIVWLLATIIFVCAQLIYNYTFWKIFLWPLPITCLVMYPFHKYWGRHIYKFVILTIFLWTLILVLYVQFYTLAPLFWLIFIIGIPIQIALAIWAFVKPKPKSPKKKKSKNKENISQDTSADKNSNTQN